MKKIIQFMSLIMALVMAFAVGAYASEDSDVTEPTTAVQEENTTLPDVTEPEEGTTTQPEEETTTQPDATEPEVTDPTAPSEPEVTDPTAPTDPTDPTDPTQPENPEIVLPKAPTKISGGGGGFDSRSVLWDAVEGVDGYDVYLKVDGEWVYYNSTITTDTYLENLISNSEYEVGVKSYIIVDDVKYQSEEYCIGIISSSESVNTAYLTLGATKDGIKLNWDKCRGVSGYRLSIKKDGKWVKIADITDPDTTTYLYKDATKNTKYQFSIRSFADGTKGKKWGVRTSKTITYPDFTKAKITSATPTNAAVTLKWNKVEDAAGYRVYVYKNSKWIYYKGIKTTSYKVTGLEASTKYKFKVRAYYQVNGKTTWGTYSDEMAVTTKAKTVKATRIAKLKKNFTDGDWSVKLSNMVDRDGYKFDYTLAVKGNKIHISYDYKNNKVMRDFEYLIDMDKHKVYLIFDDDKTYAILGGDDADVLAYSGLVMGYALDMSDAKSVTAKTAVYGGKTGVAETYTVKELGAKKTCYFVDDKIKAIKLDYSDGTTETLTVSKITDTPSASLFKLPSGYKKIKY